MCQRSNTQNSYRALTAVDTVTRSAKSTERKC